MSRIAFVNGNYVDMSSAFIAVEDRGLQFGDSIYEVIHFIEDFYIDAEAHLDRLEKSLSELSISRPLPRHTLMMHIRYLRKKNRIKEGFVYIQITRGEAPRNHLFPKESKPTLIMTVKKQLFVPFEPKKVITISDVRWKRCDIKTTNLLPNVLAKQHASEADAFEAWMVNDEGFVSEGSLSNAWIIKKGKIYTTPVTSNILPGITRHRLLTLAEEIQIEVIEKTFTVEEAYQAEEAFNSSSNAPLTPVVQINDRIIGLGVPGPLSQRLHQAYIDYVRGAIGG